MREFYQSTLTSSDLGPICADHRVQLAFQELVFDFFYCQKLLVTTILFILAHCVDSNTNHHQATICKARDENLSLLRNSSHFALKYLGPAAHFPSDLILMTGRSEHINLEQEFPLTVSGFKLAVSSESARTLMDPFKGIKQK